MADPFALPPGFTVGAAPAPPASPPAASVPPAASETPETAPLAPDPAVGAPSPSNPFAVPPGFTVGAAPPPPAGSPDGTVSGSYIPPAASGSTGAAPSASPSVTLRLPGGDVIETPSVTAGSGQASAPPPTIDVPPIVARAAPLSASPSVAPAPQPLPAVPLNASPSGTLASLLYSGSPSSSPTPTLPSAPAPIGAQPTQAPSPGGSTWQDQYQAARTAYTDAPPEAPVAAAQQPDPSQPAAPGFTLPYLAHLGGLAARDAIEGTTGLVTGLPALAARGIDYATGSKALAPVANLPQTVDNFLTNHGFAQPQSSLERYGSAIAENVLPVLETGGLGAIPAIARAAEALPSAAQTIGRLLMAPGIGTGTKVVAGTGAGAAQQLAADSGAGARGQLAAALVGGLAGGGLASGTQGYLARLGTPLTGGRPALAGQALLSRSGDPATFNARLEAGMADQQAGTATQRLPTSPATPGMLANDQNMMAFEQGVRNNTTGNDAYRQFDQARAQSQVAAIRDLADPTTHSPEERGFTIRNALDQAHGASAANTSRLYQEAAPTTNSLPLDTVHTHVASELNGVYGPGSGGPPADLKAVWRELAQRRVMPGTTLMRMSTRLGDIAGRHKMAGNRTAAAAAMRTRDAIEDIAGTPEWEQARAARRAQGEAFGRNQEGVNAAGAIRAEDRYGAPTMQDGKVGDRAIKDAGSVRQVVRALNKGVTDARAAGFSSAEIARLEENVRDVHTVMREHFIDGLMRKGSVLRDDAGNESLTVTPKQWQNYWRTHADVADHLFTSDERRLLDADFAEQQRFQDAGKANGSNTIKNAATGKFLKSLEGGKIPGEMRTVRLLAAGIPLAVAKGSTALANLAVPGLGHGIEHAAHQGAEYYFLTRGGHGAAHNLLGGLVNPGAANVAERVREAAGEPEAVHALTSRVSSSARSRIAAAVSPRPFRRRTKDLLLRKLTAHSPAISQAQQAPAA